MGSKKKVGLGLLFSGIALGAGATLAAFLRKQHKEQVYHEAELKAMDELDDMMAEDNSACAECEGIQECIAPCNGDEYDDDQISIHTDADAEMPIKEVIEPLQVVDNKEKEDVSREP